MKKLSCWMSILWCWVLNRFMFWVILHVVCEVRWLGPKKICPECYSCLAVKHVQGAASMRTVHCEMFGMVHIFIVSRKCPQLQSVVPSNTPKKALPDCSLLCLQQLDNGLHAMQFFWPQWRVYESWWGLTYKPNKQNPVRSHVAIRHK